MLSQSNVRRIKAGLSVKELAEDIARCRLLQSQSVRPVLDDDDPENSKFEIPVGGRRFQALSLLVKQKLLANTTPIPCIQSTSSALLWRCATRVRALLPSLLPCSRSMPRMA